MGQTESTEQGTATDPQEEPVNILLSEKVFNRLTREPVPEMREPEMKSDSEPLRAKNASAHYMKATATASEPILYQLDNQAKADADSEFTKNKNYWKKRLEDLQSAQEKIKTVLEEERKKGLEDAQTSLPSASASGDSKEEKKEKPCAEDLSGVADCYKAYTKEPLKCDKQVVKFVSCVKKGAIEAIKPKEKDQPEDGQKDKKEDSDGKNPDKDPDKAPDKNKK